MDSHSTARALESSLIVSYSSVCFCFSLRRYLVPAVLTIMLFIPEFCQLCSFHKWKICFLVQITTFLPLCHCRFFSFGCMINVTLSSSASAASWEIPVLSATQQSADSSQFLAPSERGRLTHSPLWNDKGDKLN